MNTTEEVLINAILRASLIIFAILAVLLSLALLLAIVVDPLKCLRSGTSFLSFNLMLSDFLCASTVFVSTVGNWSLGDGTVGTVITSVCKSFAVGSCTFAFVLAVDRYYLVAYPIKYKQIISNVKLLIVCIATWLVALSFALALHFADKYLSNVEEYHYVSLIAAAKFFSFAFINVLTVKKLRKLQANLKQQLKTSGLIQMNAEEKRLKSERKFYKIVFLMFLNYVVFFLSGTIYYHVRVSIRQSGEAQMFSEVFYISLSLLLLVLHSLVDPICYITGIRKYRKSILALRCSSRKY